MFAAIGSVQERKESLRNLYTNNVFSADLDLPIRVKKYPKNLIDCCFILYFYDTYIGMFKNLSSPANRKLGGLPARLPIVPDMRIRGQSACLVTAMKNEERNLNSYVCKRIVPCTHNVVYV